MNSVWSIFFLLSVLSVTLLIGCYSREDYPKIIDDNITVLGNIPKSQGLKGKALNIWDLQFYDDKLFLGYGSTIENTGPTHLYAYDLEEEKFQYLHKVPAEAIERFRVWNNTLIIPNSDPKKGDLDKFTFFDGEDWTDVKMAHEMAHVRDIYHFQGIYYLIGNTRCIKNNAPYCSGIMSIHDFSGSYRNDLLYGCIDSNLLRAESRYNWFFAMLEIEGKLIIPNALFTESKHFEGNDLFYIIDDNKIKCTSYDSSSQQLKYEMFYDIQRYSDTLSMDTLAHLKSLSIFSQLTYKSKTLYSLRSYSMFNGLYNSAYNNSKGMMIKDSLYSSAKSIKFPDADAIGEDLLNINNSVYALANTRRSEDFFHVYVYQSNDPGEKAESWEKILQFQYSNMARSFEYANGKFYLGMGHNEGDKPGNAGDIIEIKLLLSQE